MVNKINPVIVVFMVAAVVLCSSVNCLATDPSELKDLRKSYLAEKRGVTNEDQRQEVINNYIQHLTSLVINMRGMRRDLESVNAVRKEIRNAQDELSVNPLAQSSPEPMVVPSAPMPVAKEPAPEPVAQAPGPAPRPAAVVMPAPAPTPKVEAVPEVKPAVIMVVPVPTPKVAAPEPAPNPIPKAVEVKTVPTPVPEPVAAKPTPTPAPAAPAIAPAPKPAAVKPAAVKPAVVKPAVVKPAAMKPAVVKPVVAKRDPKIHVSSVQGMASPGDFSKNNVYTFVLTELGSVTTVKYWINGRYGVDSSGKVWLVTPDGSRENIGSWREGATSEIATGVTSYKELKPVSADVSKQVNKSGTYKIEFEWSDGAGPLYIYRVEIIS